MFHLLISSIGVFGGFGHFNLSLRFPQISELSTYLKSKGYEEVNEYFVSTGTSGYGIIKRVLIGGEGGNLVGRTVRNDSLNRTASIDGSFGFFDLGYLLYSNRRFNLYAMFGVGGGSIKITLREDYSGSFDSAFVNPPKNVEFSYGSYLVKASVQGDISLYGLDLGLKVGYYHGFGGNWEVWNKDVAGGPKINVGGPFINLIIGFGFLF